MNEISELKQGAFKNEGTQYHSYDTGKLDHEYFVDCIIHRIEKLLGTSALGSYMTNHSAEHIIEHSTSKKILGKRVPDDYFYEQNRYIIIGEAKATAADLKDSHTNDQLIDYYRCLHAIVKSDTEAKPFLILSVPFILLGEARKKIINVKRDLIENSEIDKRFIDSVDVIYTTEIDGKNIPIPQGFDINVPLYDIEYNQVSIVLDNVTYHAYESMMNINDLCYDEDNTRIATINLSHTYNQQECEAKLLFEDEVRSRQLRDEAIIRRQNILGNGSIYNSLDVFEHDDNKGNTMYTVIDGNSRLALCRDILKRTHSAPSYSIVPVRIYREKDGISRNTIEKLKERSQHDPKLQHSKSSIACKMREKSLEKMPHREIAKMFSVPISITDFSIKTIKKLDAIGYVQDDDFEHMYDIAYSIVSSFGAHNSDEICTGFDLDTVLSKTMTNKKLQRFFDRHEVGRKSLLSSIISKRGTKTPAQNAILLKWLNGKYDTEADLSGDWEGTKSLDNKNELSNTIKTVSNTRDEAEHIQNVLNVLNRKNGGISKRMSTEDLHRLKEDARVIGQTYMSIISMLDD